MDREAFESIVRSRAARIAVGPSTVRGRGNKGTVAASRDYLRAMDLAPFGTADGRQFAAALDRETERLRLGLPPEAHHWGLARKVLNIYLRDCLYTAYLERYALRRAEGLFELPLDSITAGELKASAERGRLPPWPGVRYLTPELNRVFQEVASRVAESHGLARVHLDALWWSASRD
jgi:hypothetical protein